MPELPEVETIRRDLAGLLNRKTFSRIHVRDVRALQGFGPSGRPRRKVSVADFSARLTGRTVVEVARRGKYLMFHLDGGHTLFCHLRMTGQLIYGPAQGGARVSFSFKGEENVLNFCDVRRFGEVWLAEDWRKDPSIAALGPEPLNGVDVEGWGKALRSSGAKVQSALLDQKRLAGLGNIYVTEALYLTGIRPTRRCRAVTRDEVPRLFENIRRVLQEGLRHRGVSFYSYRDASGNRGDAQRHLFAYGRAGEPCRACGGEIRGVKVGGRGTAYCPRCQK